MKVAVIGRGNIGGTIGRALSGAGHEVVYGVRDPSSEADGTSVAGIAAAIDGADAVLLAVPAKAVEQLLDEHAAALDGKLVVDATNNIGAPVANSSAAIAEAAPGARYARAFNSLGWENFADPDFDGVTADLLYSSAEADRDQVEELIAGVGLRPVFLGADQQDLVDRLLPVWFTLVQLRGTRHLAFKVLES